MVAWLAPRTARSRRPVFDISGGGRRMTNNIRKKGRYATTSIGVGGSSSDGVVNRCPHGERDCKYCANRFRHDTKAAHRRVRLPAKLSTLMAQYMRVHNRYVVRDAIISKPYESTAAFFGRHYCGGMCRNLPGQSDRALCGQLVLTFENGQVKELAYGSRAAPIFCFH